MDAILDDNTSEGSHLEGKAFITHDYPPLYYPGFNSSPFLMRSSRYSKIEDGIVSAASSFLVSQHLSV